MQIGRFTLRHCSLGPARGGVCRHQHALRLPACRLIKGGQPCRPREAVHASTDIGSILGSRVPETASEPGRPDHEATNGVASTSAADVPPPPKGLVGRVKHFFVGDKIDKERLAALGLGAVASYGFVSNVTYGAGLAVSWIAFVKQFSKSPLMPGQWKAFLAFYAGFWTIQNFLRPLRFSLALAMAPVFDRFITWVEKRMGIKRRDAFGVYLFILGSVTSISVFGSIAAFAGPLAYKRV